MMDVLMWNHLYGVMKTCRSIAMFSEISAYALFSDSRNFFIVYHILAYG
jgi:hypothetical protein